MVGRRRKVVARLGERIELQFYPAGALPAQRTRGATGGRNGDHVVGRNSGVLDDQLDEYRDAGECQKAIERPDWAGSKSCERDRLVGGERNADWRGAHE